MILKEISLKNFRNYDTLKLNLNPNINIIIGDNAQGKTNLLESIHFLMLSKSFRSNNESNLIMYDKQSFKIKGTCFIKNTKVMSEIILNIKEKLMKIDKKEIKNLNEYVLSMGNIILFYPQDLEIIQGYPVERRNFMNIELCQLSKNYYKVLSDYNKLLKIRNDYLKKMGRNIKVDMNYFNIVTNYLIDKSILISKMRKKFINELNQYISDIFEYITKEKNFHLEYITNFPNEPNEIIKKKYLSNLQKEIDCGSTIIGPHRDDIEFYIENKNVKEFGSQGQKRMSILSLKLSEIELFKKYKGETPILLLDDVFSELDDKKKKSLIKFLTDNIQVIITTTDLKHISKKLYEQADIYLINDGNIKKIEEVDYGRK